MALINQKYVADILDPNTFNDNIDNDNYDDTKYYNYYINSNKYNKSRVDLFEDYLDKHTFKIIIYLLITAGSLLLLLPLIPAK